VCYLIFCVLSYLLCVILSSLDNTKVMSRKKMMILEYSVCLFTFVAIQYVGIEAGMLLGILGAMINFVYSYAKKSNVTVTALRFSTAVRTFEVYYI
jgi:MFS superfamily sulfate permease-like transporter